MLLLVVVCTISDGGAPGLILFGQCMQIVLYSKTPLTWKGALIPHFRDGFK
jgi:hypothetical protein